MTVRDLEMLSLDHPIIFFDGHCAICNRYVQWLFRLDKKKIIRYGRLSSSIGEQLQSKLNLQSNPDTVVLLMDNKYWTESDVAFQLIKKLGGFYLIFYPLVVIPKMIRNAAYRWISRNRYSWFGRSDKCMIPSPAQKLQFVDETI